MTTTMEFRGPTVLKCLCDEPDGEVEREVWFMPLHPANLKILWEKASQFRNLFGEEISGDFKKFLEVFLRQSGSTVETNGLFWVLDDFVGVYYLTNIRAGYDAQVHYSFFDRRHIGRYRITKELLRYGFDKYKFRRLTAEIPLCATRDAFRFVERLGFVKEGRKRKASYHDGQWFDVNVFGLLKEDALAPVYLTWESANGR